MTPGGILANIGRRVQAVADNYSAEASQCTDDQGW